MTSLRVLATSRLMLAAVWLVALSSIPSRSDYQSKLDSGMKPAEIVTAHNQFSLLLNVAMVVAWITTGRWLRSAAFASGATRLSPTWAL